MKSVLSNLPDEPKAARGLALAWEPASWAPHAQVTPGSPFSPSIQRASPQRRFPPWEKARLDNWLGSLEDILSQGHFDMWESIFLETTATDAFFKSQTDCSDGLQNILPPCSDLNTQVSEDEKILWETWFYPEY